MKTRTVLIGVAALATRWWRSGRPKELLAQVPGLGLIFVFVVVSYFSWALQFGYYRYAIPLEILTGVVTMGSLILLFDDGRARMVAAVAVLILAFVTTIPLSWGRRPYTDTYVSVSVPPLPDDSISSRATTPTKEIWRKIAWSSAGLMPSSSATSSSLGVRRSWFSNLA